MYSLHVPLYLSLSLSRYHEQIGSNTNALAAEILPFEKRRRVLAFSVLPPVPLVAVPSSHEIHSKENYPVPGRGGERERENEAGDAIQVSNNRASTFRSAKPIGSIAPFYRVAITEPPVALWITNRRVGSQPPFRVVLQFLT